jgi:hypothetical protein
MSFIADIHANQPGDANARFPDGVEVWQSAATPVETNATKTAGTFARGSLEVPKGLNPGEYQARGRLAVLHCGSSLADV